MAQSNSKLHCMVGKLVAVTFFTELVPRRLLSISRNVRLFVCLSVCLCHCLQSLLKGGRSHHGHHFLLNNIFCCVPLLYLCHRLVILFFKCLLSLQFHSLQQALPNLVYIQLPPGVKFGMLVKRAEISDIWYFWSHLDSQSQALTKIQSGTSHITFRNLQLHL